MFFLTVLDTSISEDVAHRQRRHAQTRREILDAAWQIAEQNGIAGLSFREVARAVGMQAPSLYTYFDSKDALFDAMFAEGYNQLGGAVSGWSDEVAADEPVDALGTVLGNWIHFCQASLARYQLMFTKALPGWMPSEAAYAVSVDEYERMRVALGNIGITTTNDLDLYTAVASGLAAQQMANDPTGDRWVRLAPTAARMFLDDMARRNQ
jgi:AcrR family transcriptional regulator